MVINFFCIFMYLRLKRAFEPGGNMSLISLAMFRHLRANNSFSLQVEMLRVTGLQSHIRDPSLVHEAISPKPHTWDHRMSDVRQLYSWLQRDSQGCDSVLLIVPHQLRLVFSTFSVWAPNTSLVGIGSLKSCWVQPACFWHSVLDPVSRPLHF